MSLDALLVATRRRLRRMARADDVTFARDVESARQRLLALGHVTAPARRRVTPP